MKKVKLLFVLMISIAFISCTCKQNNTVQSDVVELISVTAVNELDSNVQLIDVRTPEEYAEGFINNANNINFFDDDFLSQMSVLDRDKPVYLYCKSGGRSGKAAIQLKEAGFTKVYDLEGGITKWISEGAILSQNK
jgi:rhodanese-related sulfurtransferase